MMKKGIYALALLIFLITACTKSPVHIDSMVDSKVIISGFEIPWSIEIISDNEYLFTERTGALLYYDNGNLIPLTDLPEVRHVTVAGLLYGGMMEVSLHPLFAENKWVYITYVNTDYQMSVARFVFNKKVENLEVIFTTNAFSIGSRIAWEDENHFFVTQGLGGNPFPEPGAQNLSNDGGKIHRLYADGSIPRDNPVFDANTGPTSVWTYGHRDPQGLYYDKNEKVLYSNEHGPLGGDEFNIIEKGKNYGWPIFSYGKNYDGSEVSTLSEDEAQSTTALPVAYWDRSINVAPSGLIKLEGSRFADWNGSFLMGSLPQQRLVSYNIETNETKIVLEDVGRVRDIAQLSNGNLILLIDAGSPNRGDEGRLVEISAKTE